MTPRIVVDPKSNSAQNALPGAAAAFVPRNSSAADRLPDPAPTDDDLAILRQGLERYDVLERVDRGGQGVVYRARQRGTRRQVALKVLLDGPLASERQRFRFEREIELVSRLRHENIVALHESGVVRGRLFYSMDFVEGLAIDEYVVLNDLPPREIVRLMIPVCRAIHFAHQNGVIHRDLKPDHIVIDDDGQPRVFDFGLAKDALDDGADPRFSCTGQIVGTLPYLSPEQAGGFDAKVDVRSDVYSLAVILQHLLTDAFPYPMDGSPDQVRRSIIECEALPLRRAIRLSAPDRAPRLHEITADLEAILQHALAKRKVERYQTAAELADDLECYLSGTAIKARAANPWYVLRKTIRRHRVAFGVGGAFAALLIAATVAVTLSLFEARTQRDTARSTLDAAANVFSIALEEENSVRPLPGGVAVRDRLIGRLGTELSRLEKLAHSDPALSGVAATCLEKQADIALEQGDHRQAAALYLDLVRQIAPTTPAAPNNAGRLVQAAAAYRKLASALDKPEDAFAHALDLADRALRLNPASPAARFELCRSLVDYGSHLYRTGWETKAVVPLTRAATLLREVPRPPMADAKWDRLSADLLGERGKSLLAVGQGPEGLTDLHAALELRARFVREHPADTVARNELIRSYNYVARIDRDLGDFDVAVEHLERAADIGRELSALDPTSRRWDDSRFATQCALAAIHLDQKQPDIARGYLAEAKRLGSLETDEALRHECEAAASHMLGCIEYACGDLCAAKVALEQSAATRERELLAAPNNIPCRRELARTYERLGLVNSDVDDHAAAQAYYERALQVAGPVAERDASSVADRLNGASARLNLAGFLLAAQTREFNPRICELLRGAKRSVDQIEGHGNCLNHQRSLKRIHDLIDRQLAGLELRGVDCATASDPTSIATP